MVSTWDPYYATPFLTRCTVVLIISIYLGGAVVDDRAYDYADCPALTLSKMQGTRITLVGCSTSAGMHHHD